MTDRGRPTRRDFLKGIGGGAAALVVGKGLLSQEMISRAYAEATQDRHLWPRPVVWTDDRPITATNLNGIYGHTHLIRLVDGRVVESTQAVIE